MPTIRSEFSIEQLERVLQKMAHGFPKFRRVVTSDLTLVFHYTGDGKPRRITVQFHRTTGKKCYEGTEWEYDEIEYWSFTMEAKKYLNSPHSTKISFANKENEKKIRKWIKKVMGSEKPVPRFSLSDIAEKPAQNKGGHKSGRK